MDLGDRVAIVTGGGRGIGRAAALALAKNGAHVVLAALESDEVERTAEEIRALGVKSLGCRMDVTRLSEIQGVVDRTISEFGQVDILVNAAGIWRLVESLKMTEAEWDLMTDIHLKGCFFMSQAVAREMVKRKKGSIISISSIDAAISGPNQVHYSAAKAGISSMTKCLTLEWTPLGIRVNAIAPGWILTDLSRKAWEEDGEAVLGSIPARRVGQPEDVGELAVFLASDRSDYICGAVVDVNGGLGLLL